MIKYLNNILFCFTICCLSCSRNEDKIEIYLLNERAEILDGTDYVKAKELANPEEITDYQYYKYNTVFSDEISAGRFEAKRENLQAMPFIEDVEIKSFNLKNNKIVFTDSAVKKLAALPGNMHIGTQFVIAINGEPRLTGYFMHMSEWCDWYYIRFFRSGEGSAIRNKNAFELFKGHMRGKHEDLTPPYPPKLIEAFRSSGRLIE